MIIFPQIGRADVPIAIMQLFVLQYGLIFSLFDAYS